MYPLILSYFKYDDFSVELLVIITKLKRIGIVIWDFGILDNEK